MTDCPICLDEMTRMDMEHPLQCITGHCHYNFCHHCIESLIVSSKDDYMESSDGNHHTKVFLCCPNCRYDLSKTIRETLLLRKVDTLLYKLKINKQLKQQQQQQQQQIEPLEEQDNGGLLDHPYDEQKDTEEKKLDSPKLDATIHNNHQQLEEDFSLTASQLALKDAMKNDAQVKHAINAARKREAQFLEQKNKTTTTTTTTTTAPTTTESTPIDMSVIPNAVLYNPTIATMDSKEEEELLREEGDDETKSTGTQTSTLTATEIEEYGIEVDADIGIHDSFHMPIFRRGSSSSIVASNNNNNKRKKLKINENFIDVHLLGGLEYFLSKHESIFITKLLISGDTDQLAIAAETLYTVSKMIQTNPSNVTLHQKDNDGDDTNYGIKATTPPTTTTTTDNHHRHHKKTNNKQNSKRDNYKKLSSVFQLIEENELVNCDSKEKNISAIASVAAAASPTNAGGNNPLPNHPPTSNHHATLAANAGKRTQHRKFEREMEKRRETLTNFPLPVRMPKFVQLEGGNQCYGIQFMNYTWDGTIMDAFCKIVMSGIRARNAVPYQNRKKILNHVGVVQNILDNNSDVRIELPNQNRILISKCNREISKHGIVKGDVLTHINGQSIIGMKIEDVDFWPQALLSRQQPQAPSSPNRTTTTTTNDDDISISLVFNAERSVSEALKRRAEAMYYAS